MRTPCFESWFSIMFSWNCNPRMPSNSMIWFER